LKYKIHYEGKREGKDHKMDFEMESEYFIADLRLDIMIYAIINRYGGEPENCRHLSIEKID
jgi:hypothetical protein